MPRQLSSLKGREALVRTLQTAEFSAEAAHALLFLGPEGSDLDRLVEALAAAFLCTTAAATDDPAGHEACGHCEACRYFDAETHPDYHRPLASPGKALAVDDLREALSALKMRPQVAEVQVFVLDLDRISEQGQNILLKSLEEPPPKVRFLLTASGREKILATILSRCRLYQVERLPEAVIVEQLLAEGCSADEATLYARLAKGLPGLARQAAQDSAFQERRAKVERLLAELFTAGPGRLLGPVLEAVLAEKEAIDAGLALLELYLSDWLLCSQPGLTVGAERVLPSARQLYSQLEAKLGAERCLEVFAEALRDVQEIRAARSLNASAETLYGQALLRLAARFQPERADYRALATLEQIF